MTQLSIGQGGISLELARMAQTKLQDGQGIDRNELKALVKEATQDGQPLSRTEMSFLASLDQPEVQKTLLSMDLHSATFDPSDCQFEVKAGDSQLQLSDGELVSVERLGQDREPSQAMQRFEALRSQIPSTPAPPYAPTTGNTYNAAGGQEQHSGAVDSDKTYLTQKALDSVDPDTGQRYVVDTQGQVHPAEAYEDHQTRNKSDGSKATGTKMTASLAQGKVELSRGQAKVRMDLNQVRVQMGQMGLDIKKDGSIAIRAGLGKEGKGGTLSFGGKSDFGSSEIYQHGSQSAYYVDVQFDGSSSVGWSKYSGRQAKAGDFGGLKQDGGGSVSASTSSMRQRSFAFKSHAEAAAFKAVMQDTHLSEEGQLQYTGHNQAAFAQFKPRLQALLGQGEISRDQLQSLATGESTVMAGGKQFSGGLDGGSLVSVGFSLGAGDGHRYQVSKLNDHQYRVIMQQSSSSGGGVSASSAPIAGMGASTSTASAKTMVADIDPAQVQGDLKEALQRALAGEKVPGINVKTRVTEETDSDGSSANLVASYKANESTVQRTIEIGAQTIHETDGRKGVHVGLLADDHDFSSTFRVSRNGDEMAYEFIGQIKSDDPDDLRVGLARLTGQAADPSPEDLPPVGKNITVRQRFSKAQIDHFVAQVKAAPIRDGDVEMWQHYKLASGGSGDLNDLREALDQAHGDAYLEGQAVSRFIEEQGRAGMDFLRSVGGEPPVEIEVEGSKVYDGGAGLKQDQQRLAGYQTEFEHTQDSRGYVQLAAQMQRDIDETKEQITALKEDHSLDGVIDNYRYAHSDEDYMVFKREKLEALSGNLEALQNLQSQVQGQSRVALMQEKLQAAESTADYRRVGLALRQELKETEAQLAHPANATQKSQLQTRQQALRTLLSEARTLVHESEQQDRVRAPQSLEITPDQRAHDLLQQRLERGSTRTKTVTPEMKLSLAERGMKSALSGLNRAQSQYLEETMQRAMAMIVTTPDEVDLMQRKEADIKEMGIRLREYQTQYQALEDPTEKAQLAQRIAEAAKYMQQDYASLETLSQRLQHRLQTRIDSE